MAKKTPKDQTGCDTEETSGSRPESEEQKPEEAESEESVTPVREKIGEPRGNLRGRSDWFRRRSGDSEP
jgi:hypothetical protein